jgi:hypothetical protein
MRLNYQHNDRKGEGKNMEPRERIRQSQAHEPAGAMPSTPDQTTAALRQAGSDLLAAADDAINRALSADSEAFLFANRQEGGQ